MDITTVTCLFVGAYLLGSIPFGLLIGFTRGVDVRRSGSGNIGATNILRTLGRGAALLTLVLDLLKGLVPVLASRLLFETGISGAIIVGAAAVAGHAFPLYLRFRGGKGVSTTLGVIIGISPLAAFLSFLVWLAVYLARRIVSLASILAAASLPVFLLLLPRENVVLPVFGFLVCGLVLVSHRSNIRRLLEGKEPRTTLSR